MIPPATSIQTAMAQFFQSIRGIGLALVKWVMINRDEFMILGE